uniref:Phosphatidylserine decarboxylase proenzyme n=1 Tax=Candidatus Kentrum sp. DK TaxID=2126562 RepID=A0A450SBT2_9GAMM|nr:MAG: phosphatidylserine decarboxylase [Candidatus Kentron sp. DK]
MNRSSLFSTASFSDYLRAIPQYLYPGHLLSRLLWQAARIRSSGIKERQIRWFIHRYQVDMGEAIHPNPATYPDFNSFFTRALHPAARPMAPDGDAVISPADGHVSQFGTIKGAKAVQAKGRDYSVEALLGDGAGDENSPRSPLASLFPDGQFITVYLSPRDYHRVHMPVAGHLREMRYIPGRLFSVDAATTRVIPRLFARNERVVLLFHTKIGPMALIMVGAVLVGSMETVWAGTVAPARRAVDLPAGSRWRTAGSHVRSHLYEDGPEFERGQEIGRFNMGSTVIVLFPPETVRWDESLYSGALVRMGESVGSARRDREHNNQ